MKKIVNLILGGLVVGALANPLAAEEDWLYCYGSSGSYWPYDAVTTQHVSFNGNSAKLTTHGGPVTIVDGYAGWGNCWGCEYDFMVYCIC